MFLSPFNLDPATFEFLAAEAEAAKLGAAYLASRSENGPDAEATVQLRESYRAATAKVDAIRAASR